MNVMISDLKKFPPDSGIHALKHEKEKNRLMEKNKQAAKFNQDKLMRYKEKLARDDKRGKEL